MLSFRNWLKASKVCFGSNAPTGPEAIKCRDELRIARVGPESVLCREVAAHISTGRRYTVKIASVDAEIAFLFRDHMSEKVSPVLSAVMRTVYIPNKEPFS